MRRGFCLRAFSLIEFLMVMAIISIASGIVLAGLSTGRTEKQLESAAQEVVATLRDAQNKSLTGHQLIADTIPCSYRFSWSGSGGSLIYVYKDASDVCSLTSTVSILTISTGVTFSNSGSVEFSLPHGTVTPTTLILTKSSQQRVVCVRNGGLIETLSGASC